MCKNLNLFFWVLSFCVGGFFCPWGEVEERGWLIGLALSCGNGEMNELIRLVLNCGGGEIFLCKMLVKGVDLLYI